MLPVRDLKKINETDFAGGSVRWSCCLVEFVHAHWKEDWYFGYQCLNGSNPLLLRRTQLIPPNMSVTSEMLRPFLPEGSSLEHELLVC